jgi:hypothetical protein
MELRNGRKQRRRGDVDGEDAGSEHQVLAANAQRADGEALGCPTYVVHLGIGEDSIRDAHSFWVGLQVRGDFLARRPDEIALGCIPALRHVLGIRVAGQTQLLRIAQGANGGARIDGVVDPLAAGLRGVADGDVGDGSVRLIAPFDAGRGVDLRVRVRPQERVEQRVDGQGGRGVADRGQEMVVEAGGEAEQAGLASQLLVEQLVMVAAGVVGDVAV